MNTAIDQKKSSQLAQYDAIDVEVVRHKLNGIAEEMQSTLLRSSFSPIVKEGMDASASLFTRKGECLAQACAVPIHLATLIPVVHAFMGAFPKETMKEGDVFIMNDPYLGGTHLPDIALVAPIFVRGEIAGFAATMTHHQDVGGMTPGSTPTNATEIYQEGIRIPPLRYMEAGVPNETLIKLLRLNVRMPHTFIGDLNAQLAACQIGARRIVELAEHHGDVAKLYAMCDDLLDQSEKLTRAQLMLIPNGTYRASDYLDNDGVDLDRNVPIAVAVTINNGTFHVDFTGTSQQVRGPFNVAYSGSLAAAYFAVRALTDPNIPTNAGCFRAVTLHRPEGSLVSPIEPAPVGARTATIKRITSCILGAFKDVLPDKVPADSANVLFSLSFGGVDRQGTRYVAGEILVGGSGASSSCDGVDVIETDATNCMNLPVEALEMEAPIRVNRIELREGSGGQGTYRGGLGIVKEFEFLGEETVLTHRGERHFSVAKGASGGGPGANSSSTINRADGTEEEIPSKLVTTLRRGDRLTVRTPGGGGYGPAAARAEASTNLDKLNGKAVLVGSEEIGHE